VVILRYNTGKSLGGRSGCMSCLSKLTYKDLFPVFSYVYLKGKCRKCGSKISIQYPLVELATAFSFLAIFLKFSDSLDLVSIIFFFIVFALFIVIFVYDIYHKIIPNGLAYTLAGLALIYRLFLTPFSNIELIHVLDLLSGFIIFTPFFLLWLISRGRWIGLGDAKLVLSIGWFLGIIYGVSAIIIAFWIGAVVSILILLIFRLKHGGKHITMKSEIPFAPFLIIGFIIAFFYQIDVLQLGLFFLI